MPLILSPSCYCSSTQCMHDQKHINQTLLLSSQSGWSSTVEPMCKKKSHFSLWRPQVTSNCTCTVVRLLWGNDWEWQARGTAADLVTVCQGVHGSAAGRHKTFKHVSNSGVESWDDLWSCFLLVPQNVWIKHDSAMVCWTMEPPRQYDVFWLNVKLKLSPLSLKS